MLAAVAIFAIAIAAFCVWLTVRIVNRRERRAKRTGVAMLILGLTAYPLSLPWVDAFLQGRMVPSRLLDARKTFYSPLDYAGKFT